MRTKLFRTRGPLVGLLAFALFGLGAVMASLSSAQPPETSSRTVSEAEAASILGRPMPVLTNLPLGLHRVALTANPVDVPQINVVASYAIADLKLVELTAFRSSSIERLDPQNTEELDLGGVKARVSVRRVERVDRGWAFVTYTWSRAGQANALTVHLLDGITREMADEIAKSIR